jgi:hypothetical protein
LEIDFDQVVAIGEHLAMRIDQNLDPSPGSP